MVKVTIRPQGETMSIYLRGEIWWVYISVKGYPRLRQSTHTSDKEKAEAIHDELKAGIRKQKDAGKTLGDALKLWLTASPRTDKEKSAITVFRRYYSDRPLSQVNGHDILDATSDYSASNYNRTANIIRAAISLANDRKWCNGITIYRRKTEPDKLRFLSKDEWARLESRLTPHVKSLAQFAISTGLRQSNIFNLQWSNVDLERGVTWVDSTEAKGKKAIPVPLSKYAIDVLTQQKGKHEVFVFTYKGKPIGSVKNAWNNALVRAKIDLIEIGKDKNGEPVYRSTFRWHDLRHTWASWHVQNGTPLAVLKELGGWADISMVMRYAHLSPDHLRKYASNSVA